MQPTNPDWTKGIDVSNQNGSIDWDKAAFSGITFAFAKATEGETFRDSAFQKNYSGMKVNGILRGAYCFSRPGSSSAVAEVDAFVSTVNAAGGFDGLPPVLDLEDSGGMSPNDLSKYVLDWMTEVKAKTGRQGILYASPSFIKEHLDQAVAGLKLWIANYGVPRPEDAPPFKTWTFWQNSSQGSVKGIIGNVDLDWFAGTFDELKVFCGIEKTATPVKVQTSKGGGDVQVPELKQGVSGHVSAVKAVQGAIGATVDGVFGPKTDAAVKRFQGTQGIGVDGIVGSQTWGKILT